MAAGKDLQWTAIYQTLRALGWNIEVRPAGRRFYWGQSTPQA